MDPFDSSGPFVPLKPRNTYRKALSDDESSGVMRKLAGYTTSALQTGLNILDTPGSIVRGAIGSAIGARPPAGERTNGRNLTDALGLTGRYDKGWGSWGLGLGAEILTDPLTYFTGGAHHALTDSGKALAKAGATKGWSRRAMLEGFQGTETSLLGAGRTAEEIAHLRDAGRRIATPEMERAVQFATGKTLQANVPLGALGGIGAPFRGPSFLFGTGQRAQDIAGKMDWIGDKLKYGTMLGRWANGLFDSNVSEAVGGATQRAMAKYGAPALDAARSAGRDSTYRTVSLIDSAIKGGAAESEVLRGAQQAAEGVRLRGVSPTAAPAANEIGSLIHRTEADQIAAANRAGLPLLDASDPFVRYAPRQGVDIQTIKDRLAGNAVDSRSMLAPQVITRNNLPTVTGANFHRDDVYRGVPGGTEQLNDFATQFAGVKKQVPQVTRALKKEMWLEAQANGVNMTRDLGKQLDAKSRELAEKLPQLPREHSAHGIGLYSPNQTLNVARSAEQHARTMQTQAAVYGFLGDNARFRSGLGSDSVPLSKALDDLGFTHTRPADLTTGTPMEGALVQGFRAMAKQGAGMVDPFLMGPNKDLRKALDQFGISRAHYNELVESHGKWSTPEVLKGPAGAFKGLTQTFKNFAYPIWVPSHVRNASSAFLNNLASGTKLGDHALAGRLMRNTATADELRRVMPEIPAGITDEAARDFARREMFANGKVFDGHAGQADLDNAIAAKLQSQAPGRITPTLFGSDRTGGGSFLGDTARLLGGGVRDQVADVAGYIRSNPFQSPFGLNGLRSPIKNPFADAGPLRQDGIWGATSDNPALATGRQVGGNIEDFFRAANFLGGRRQGLNSATAGQALRDLHFDYDKLTRFEKNYMRTLFPFYTYMRKNLPLQASNVAHNPALPLTQMRVMQGGRGSEDYVPEHLAGGVAIPIGGANPGSQRFISSFGTPMEEALERIKFKNGLPDLPATAMAYLANGNPFIKAPIEQIFNTQLSSGRRLSDLRPQGLAKAIGSLWGDDNPQLLAQVMANTPFTRFFSTFDKATDGRKPLWARALNLGTGVKLTDVDMEKAQAIEAAKARNEILSSMPHIAQYTNFYPRRGEEGNLSPDEIEMLRMLRTMQQKAKKIGIVSR